MYFLDMLWVEAVSSAFKLQQGFRVFIENIFKRKSSEPMRSPGLAFSLSCWCSQGRGWASFGKCLDTVVPIFRMGDDFFPFQPNFLIL